MLLRILALLSLVLSVSVNALELAGRDLLIPIAGRTPGAFGTFWQTDLVISNHSLEYKSLRVRVDLRADSDRYDFEVNVPAASNVVIEDFVRTKLGRDTALGTLRITTGPSDAQISAYAIVHNTSGDEPLGQTIPALPSSLLQKRSVVAGLQIGNGNRSNVGVANPHDDFVQVALFPVRGTGEKIVTLAPFAYMQIDAATLSSFEVADGGSVLVIASRPVYAYGSVIRGGNGDPQFLLPLETRKSADAALQPACTNPARLTFAVNPAPGWIVVFRALPGAAETTAVLAARYGFTPTHVYDAALGGFAAELTPEQVAGLRCEPAVGFVQQNAWGSTAGSTTAAERDASSR